MKSEKEKMLSGEHYYAFGEELSGERLKARILTQEYNALLPGNPQRQKKLLKELLGETGENISMEPPFRCDYGYNIKVGNNFYSNFNLVILDCAPVVVGDNALIGPDVGIYTAGHPLHHSSRTQSLEFALPVVIGNNVWIGGHVVINPGVTIGDNVVIGSGSVVTRDIPSNVVALGNPCKVLRKITDKDR
jgi:acetyltransferase-like isoleucine patch superfamily enzyme